MFVNNLNPTLFSIGPIEIRYYGLVYVIGFVLVYYFLNRERERIGIKKGQIDNVMLFGLIGLILGARLFHFLFTGPAVLIRNPLEFFMIWRGGMSFFGALIGVVLAVYLYARRIKARFFRLADVMVIPAAFALFLGRIANFINSEILGKVSDLPWCVVFQKVDNICRHPYQIYASFSHLALFFVLIGMNKKAKKDGVLFAGFMIGYGFLRLLTDFFVDYTRYFGLTIWQYMSIGLLITGIIVLKNTLNKR